MVRKDLINKKFGNLLVLSKNDTINKNNRTYWNCVCDCGNEKITHTNLLTSGRCKSCGCLQKIAHNKEPDREKAIIKIIFLNSIKKRSKKINLPYDISIEYFSDLIKKPCYYCGIEHSNYAKDRNYHGTKKYVTSDTIVYYNGVDRIDSSLGYLTDNVVPCCRSCNCAKNTMSDVVFKEFITRVYNFYCNVN